MTVSFALRGHPHASAATRERLRRLATDMGYRPNPLLAAHMAQVRAGKRSSYAGTIAYCGIGPVPTERNAPENQRWRVYLGARQRAETLGFRLEYFALDNPKVDGRRLSEIFRARGISGVILAANCLVPVRGHLEWPAFSLAAIGRTEVGHDLHRTMGDYYRAVREICQSCRSRGYERIGMAISREHETAHQGLHRSALLGCQAEWPRRQHVPVLIAEDWGREPFLAWFRRHKPDVIITSEDDPLAWLRSAGVRVPEDVGLIRPHVNNRSLGIGGFLFEDTEVGAAAVDLVAEQLNHNERGLPTAVKRVLLPGHWFEGRSLRPVTAVKT